MKLVYQNCCEVWIGAITESNNSNSPLVSKLFDIVELESNVVNVIRSRISNILFVICCFWLFHDKDSAKLKELVNNAFLARNPKYHISII